MKASVTWVLLWLLPAGLAGAAGPGSPPEVVIGPTHLEPPTLRTQTEQRVTFVNRSGRIVHVDLHGDADQHHVFQVPGAIWAIFHRPGPHPFVVHFERGEPRELHGLVQVEAGPAREVDPLTCGWVTVMEVCIEP